MRWIDKVILYATKAVFLLCSIGMIYAGLFLFRPEQMDGPYWKAVLPLGMLLFGAAIFILTAALWRLLQKSEKKHHYIVAAVFGIIIVVQFLIVWNARISIRHDALKVFDEALSMLKTGGITPGDFDDYFMRYTNNWGILFFTYIWLKLADWIGILALDSSGGMLYVQMINMFCIDLALWIGWLFCHRIWGRKTEDAYLLFILFCPLLYVWAPFYYTNTISMPFYMSVLYFICRMEKEHKWKYSILFLTGILTAVGFFLRATQIIVVIALVIYLLLKKRGKINLQKSLVCFLALLCGVCIGIGGQKMLVHKYAAFDTTDTAFPAIHWIAMGLHGNGEYDMRDEQYTRSFLTKTEKKTADEELLQERIHQLGGIGIVKLYIEKLMHTFGDGTGNYPAELSMSDTYGTCFQVVYGRYRTLIYIYGQVFYMFLCMVSCMAVIRKWKDTEVTAAYPVMLTLTGAFLFHMLWEAGTIYSIGFLPLFYILAADSFPQLLRKDIAKPIQISCIGTSVCVAAIIAGILGKIDIGLQYSVNQFMFVWGSYLECDKDTPVCQTFQSAYGFDTVEFMIHNSKGDQNDSLYQVYLLDTAGKMVAEKKLKGSGCADLVYEKIDYRGKPGNYMLQIQKISGEDQLSLAYYNTGNWDAYKHGCLKSGQTALTKADLTMRVYRIE